MGFSTEFIDISGWAFALLGIILGLWLLLIVATAAFYVLESLGLYTLAKRRAIHHAWLSWLPVGKLWILGSISDQYQYVVKNKVTNRRKILLLLSVVGLLLAFICLSFAGPIHYQIAMHNFHLHYNPYAHTGSTLMMVSLGAFIFCIMWLCVSFAKIIYRFIALYDLYTSCSPMNNVLFMVLSVFFPFLRPVFIFVCRNNDAGMPPRRTAYQQTPPQSHDPYHEQPENTEYL